MVASSRSSLRRHTLQGDQSTPQSSHAVEHDTSPKQTTQTLRPKRTRISSTSDRDSLQKRRRLSNNSNHEEIKIPLRGRGLVPKPVLPDLTTRSIPTPDSTIITQNTTSDNSPLESPSLKSQYDQIKRIEEKARAQIQQENASLAPKEDRRRLRSEHGGTRHKTELSQYFPAFDEMLNLFPLDPDVLTSKTRIVIVDDTPDFEALQGRSDPFGAHKPLHNVQLIDFASSLSTALSTSHDPLSPDVYYKAHRKAERHEKQMKNGDKERAQHEKYQLERLLEELRGPDWLKTLGITGVTDTEKKRYEPKRALFIRETKALIDKFKRWKEEEKRRKLEREQAVLEEAAAEMDDDLDAGTGGSTSTRRIRRQGNARASSQSRSAASSDKGPDSSEIDALASQQLLQEAKSANVSRKKVLDVFAPLPEVHKPFVSFFVKRHLRDAAVAGRQRGRTVLAFGEPVPELVDEEFELPDNILTEDAIRASQRNKRRVKRSTD